MATTSVTISATCLNGKPLEALERLIAQRQREMGETTSEAVIATAINMLSSIRAATKVVNVKKASGFVNVAAYPALVPSVRPIEKKPKKGKAKKSKGNQPKGNDGEVRLIPCLRWGPRGHHADVTYYRAVPKGTPMKTCQCYLIEDKRGNSDKAKVTYYYVIAQSEKQARTYAEARRANRIRQFKGMAKWTLGQAQSQISQKGVAGETVTAAAKQIGIKELQVAVYERGWGSGSVSVTVADNLRYSALALKGGPGEVTNALMRAANRTAGIINAHYKKFHPFEDERAVQTPFPEVAHKR